MYPLSLQKILTVSELNSLIKRSLEESFDYVILQGEVSGFKNHAASGHWYFNLKDNSSVICCNMWKSYNKQTAITPQDGIKVVVKGRITVYPPRGTYQIEVHELRPLGVGELQEAFERLKQKLNEEGLFDSELKKPLPKFPKRIGIITASDAAAFQDMLNTAKRRYPLVEIFIIPTKMQGVGSAQEVVQSIKLFNKLNDVDIIIIARGGGSIEDLWAFNEEIVARAIHSSKIPIVTGIGHEVDTTIADYVSDLRAPTPTAAMELCTPDNETIINNLESSIFNIENCLTDMIDYRLDLVRRFISSYGFRIPLDIVRNKTQLLDNISFKLENNLEKKLNLASNKIKLLSALLEKHNVDKTLEKGFVLVKQNDKLILKSDNLKTFSEFSLRFHDKEIIINKKDDILKSEEKLN